ncbi:MAG: glycogen debranching protein GlgX [Verrucomicrobia bacterium]|nr:glycogen debranching protein GlgX [Verrucomicrobiota bacterium]
MSFQVLPGSPHPLGAHALPGNDGTVNFAIYSQHATAVDLCLFDPKDSQIETARIRLTQRSGFIWHAEISGCSPLQNYGYRLHGPWNPEQGHFFNPNKLLFDPLARDFSEAAIFHPSMLATDPSNHSNDPSTANRTDSGPHVPRSVVIANNFDWEQDQSPATPYADSLIYELHVKGFTQLHPDVPEPLRGTYAGLANDAAIQYLSDLGITAVQLMPVHYHLDDDFLIDRGLVNYWGYNTVGFFAPDPRYAAGPDSIAEFKGMVKALHQAGIEVILDVVFNHTGEAGVTGPSCCFRGIDNLVYYRTQSKNPGVYQDFTGCGNTLNTTHPQVLQLIMDSLRYWVSEMHVDGFRFDLAVTLGREPTNYNQHSAFFKAIMQDPVLSQVKMIAEPWDLGRGGYQVGHFPYGWSELNGRYRDTIRRFWKGDHGVLPEFSSRLTGSQDLYGPRNRSPQASINFITSHDGFTLRDLVSYNHKHNEDNLENNRDGSDHDMTWNHGVEGETDDPDILALRERQRRNFLTTLLLSRGVPFLLAGDELGRTQNGNNNAYCQDNELNWIDWSSTRTESDFLEFVKNLIAFRKQYPTLRRTHFYSGKPSASSGTPDIAWYRPDGADMTPGDWHAQTAGALSTFLDGPVTTPILLLLNARAESLTFTLPAPPASDLNAHWQLEIDTADPHGKGRSSALDGKSVLSSRAIQVWTLQRVVTGE